MQKNIENSKKFQLTVSTNYRNGDKIENEIYSKCNLLVNVIQTTTVLSSNNIIQKVMQNLSKQLYSAKKEALKMPWIMNSENV